MLTLFENGVIKFQHDETRLKSLQWEKQMPRDSKWIGKSYIRDKWSLFSLRNYS